MFYWKQMYEECMCMGVCIVDLERVATYTALTYDWFLVIYCVLYISNQGHEDTSPPVVYSVI